MDKAHSKDLFSTLPRPERETHSPDNPLVALLLANDAVLAAECRRIFEQRDDYAPPTVVPTAREAFELLQKQPDDYDAVLVGEKLGDTTGLEFYASLQEEGYEYPVLFLISSSSNETVNAAMEAEVDEFILTDITSDWQRFLPYFLDKLVANHAEYRARKRFEDALANIATGVSSAAGATFFRLLTIYLARALHVHVALIGELRGEKEERVRTLSVSVGGETQPNFDFFLEHAPCEEVIGKGFCLYTEGVCRQFPQDKYLHAIGAECYVGVGLRDSQGNVRALLSIIDTKPAEDPNLLISTLRIFAARAEMEIERQRNAAALETQANILEQVGDAIICADLDGHIKSWNKRAEELFGYSRDEVLGKPMNFIYPQSSNEFLAHKVMEPLLIHGKHTLESQLRHRDNQRFDALVSLSLERNSMGDVTGVICCCTDISRQRRAELRERSAEQRLAFHLRASPLAYIEWDRQKKICAWNPAAERIFGYAESAALGCSPRILFRNGALEWLDDAFRQMEETCDGFQSTCENYTETGQLLTCEWSGTPLLDEDDNLVGWATMARDITERVELQRHLEASRDAEAAANRAKDDFIAVMNHEVRTPMNSIIGFADLLLESELDEQQQDCAEIVKANGYTLLELLNNLLYYSRLESGNLRIRKQETDLLLLLDELEEALNNEASSKDLKLTFSAQEGIPEIVLTDHAELRQALVNVLGNAVKFTSRGTVHVELSAQPDYENDGQFWNYTFAVKDTGIGISEDKAQTLFQTFRQADSSSTRQFGGTGLGLAITKRICSLLDGEIDVESTPGKGSIFYLRFRFEAVEGKSLTGLSRREHDKAGEEFPVRILFAEDHEAGLHVGRRILESVGYEPHCARDARSALTELTRNSFEVIFLCLESTSPETLEIASRIREGEFGEENRDAFLVAVSGFADDEYRRRCSEVGINEHLTKPLSLSSMTQLTCRAYHLKERERA